MSAISNSFNNPWQSEANKKEQTISIMKNLIITIMVLLGLVTTTDAKGHNMGTGSEVYTATNTTDYYEGGFTSINMNGSQKNPANGIVTTVATENNSIGQLISEPFKVGKMPGSIQVKASNLTVDATTGNFSGSCRVVLKIVVMTQEFDGNIKGTISNGKLIYTVECPAEWLGIPFHTKVTFQGNK
jgi:hypothetical protein